MKDAAKCPEANEGGREEEKKRLGIASGLKCSRKTSQHEPDCSDSRLLCRDRVVLAPWVPAIATGAA
jgi:hypothetical protein